MSDPLERLPAHAVADQVRAGSLSAVDVLEHHLQRIEQHAQLGAFVFVDDERARSVAKDIDRRVAAGEDPGLLAGVPLGIKVLESVEGWPNSGASTVFKDRVSPSTGTNVRRLLEAGAVPVGLTASPPMGLLPYTVSALYGTCRNPWDPTRTPGGSSGGAAAALSAGLVPLATGSDMGGSIRIPAAFTGVVGIKPTYGRVPRGPGYLGMLKIVHMGPLARSVRDAARYLDVTAGPDQHDPGSVPPAVASLEQTMMSLQTAGLRVVVTDHLGSATAEPAVAAVFHQAAAILIEAAGLERIDVRVTLPEDDDLGLGALSGMLAADEVPESEDSGKTLQIMLDLMAAPGGVDTVAILIGGKLPGGARTLQRLLPVFRQLDRRGLLPSKLPGGSLKRLIAGQHFSHSVDTALAALFSSADVLLTPTTAFPAFAATGPMPTRIGGRQVGASAAPAFTMWFNTTGHPAVSVPAGLVDGLPVGMQIVTRRHEDHVALTLAAQFEQAQPWPVLAPGY